jgi:four helix bundle protein
MGDFKELVVWQRARKLAVEAYGLTRTFPATELHGLCAQIRRASVSIAANIAESTGRRSNVHQARLYQIAIASSRELESHLLVASDLGFIASPDLHRVAASLHDVERMLIGLVRSTRRGTHVSGVASATSTPQTLDSRPP